MPRVAMHADSTLLVRSAERTTASGVRAANLP